MSDWSSEEVFEGLERWLKECRDECGTPHVNPAWNTINILLDEVRAAGVEGFLPWQRLTEPERPVKIEPPLLPIRPREVVKIWPNERVYPKLGELPPGQGA